MVNKKIIWQSGGWINGDNMRVSFVDNYLTVQKEQTNTATKKVKILIYDQSLKLI